MVHFVATQEDGDLRPLDKCFIEVPPDRVGNNAIFLRILPEISDAKSAAYNDEPIIGRSFPLKTFSHGENRSISMNVPFIVTKTKDIAQNLNDLKALESAVYPRDSENSVDPFLPPAVCKVQCGTLLASTGNQAAPLCCVLKSYSVSFPQNVPWDQDTYLPYRYTVNLQWEVVYATERLPGAEKIIQSGGAFGGI